MQLLLRSLNLKLKLELCPSLDTGRFVVKSQEIGFQNNPDHSTESSYRTRICCSERIGYQPRRSRYTLILSPWLPLQPC